MPRWEPYPRERLERAAITLFAEQGYDSTTVDEIAAAAGLARSGFFRYFRDKREILSGGQRSLASQLGDGIRAAPREQSALRAIETAFRAVATTWFTSDRRDQAPKRLAVISSSTELLERELLKRRGMTDAVLEALRSRGVPGASALVAAELATLAFSETVVAWGEPDNPEEFYDILRRNLRELHFAAVSLT